MDTTRSPGTGLARTGGFLLVAVSLLHLLATTMRHWPRWLAGELRDRSASAESVAVFWSQPAGFGVATLLLGLLAVGAARRGALLPGYVAWALLAWVALCIALVGPGSGFTLVLVPVALLVVADLRGRRAARRTAAPDRVAVSG